MKISADASSVQQSLTPAERAFQSLEKAIAKTTSVFDPLAEQSEAAAQAQEQFNARFAELSRQLGEGLDPREYTRAFEALQEEVAASAEEYGRAGRIIEANRSPLERYDQEVVKLRGHLEACRISQETFDRAVARAGRSLTDAERAARGLDTAVESVADNTLKFNELSGVFSILPGPIGNIAGRLSGLSSAAEGLNRVFAGGFTSGISNVAASFTALANPATIAAAGIAGVGAAAAGITSGLLSLEDRVERLGNLADQLGVSFEFVQVLEEAANRSGVSVESLQGSFTRLQRTLVGAGEESKAAQRALSGLGISVDQLNQLSQEEQIELIGRQIAAIEDPAKRTAAAVELFGRSGAQLLPFFNNLEGAANDVERFGSTLSQVDRQRIDGLGASFDGVSVAVRALGQEVLLPFIGIVDSVANVFSTLIGIAAEITEALGQILGPELDTLGRAFQAVGVVAEGVGRLFVLAFDGLATILEPLGGSLLPAIGAGLAFINRQIIIGAIGNLANFFTAASRAVITFSTSAATASVSTAALGVAIRGALLSTGIGAIPVVVGLAAGKLLEWAFASDAATEKLGGTQAAAQGTADEVTRLADELAKEETALADANAKAIDNVRAKLSDAIDLSLQFGESGFDAAAQYQEAIAQLQDQFDRGILNETAFRREAEKADAAFRAQIQTLKDAAAETEAITRRVDGLLEKANELPRIEQDINAVQAEIARVEAAIVAARQAGQQEQADSLVARLAQLDQLQANLDQQSDEIAQGFSQGFDAAFANVDNGINSLINKAAEFGNAGAVAASQLQEGIAAAQDKVRDGILTKTAFDNEVRRQQELFEERVEQLRKAEQLGQQIAQQQEAIDERRFEIELDRARELATVRGGPIEVGDLRTAEGAAAFLNLASGAEDPAIAESRRQTRELQAMNRKLDELATQKAEILGGVG
jgi:hypothetical protein